MQLLPYLCLLTALFCCTVGGAEAEAEADVSKRNGTEIVEPVAVPVIAPETNVTEKTTVEEESDKLRLNIGGGTPDPAYPTTELKLDSASTKGGSEGAVTGGAVVTQNRPSEAYTPWWTHQGNNVQWTPPHYYQPYNYYEQSNVNGAYPQGGYPQGQAAGFYPQISQPNQGAFFRTEQEIAQGIEQMQGYNDYRSPQGYPGNQPGYPGGYPSPQQYPRPNYLQQNYPGAQSYPGAGQRPVPQNYPGPQGYPVQNYPGQGNYFGQSYPGQSYPSQQGFQRPQNTPFQQGYPGNVAPQNFPQGGGGGNGYPGTQPSGISPYPFNNIPNNRPTNYPNQGSSGTTPIFQNPYFQTQPGGYPQNNQQQRPQQQQQQQQPGYPQFTRTSPEFESIEHQLTNPIEMMMIPQAPTNPEKPYGYGSSPYGLPPFTGKPPVLGK